MARRGRKPKGKGPAKRREPLHPLSNVDHARNNNDSEAQEEQVLDPAAPAPGTRKRARGGHEEAGPPAKRAAAINQEEAELAAEFCNWLRTLPLLERLVRPGRRRLLPPVRDASRKTLILDMDNTLIKATHLSPTKSAMGEWQGFITLDGRRMTFARRPGVVDFLERAAQMYEVVLFTAASQDYAEPLLDCLDPEGRYFVHRLYRHHCLERRHGPGSRDVHHFKDLTALGRDLSRTLIVDDTPRVFSYQLNNGVPIKAWHGDMADRELPLLLPFLEGLAAAPGDLRPLIGGHFPLHRRALRTPVSFTMMVREAVRAMPEGFPCAVEVAPAADEWRPPRAARRPPPDDAHAPLHLLADACAVGLDCVEDLNDPLADATNTLPARATPKQTAPVGLFVGPAQRWQGHSPFEPLHLPGVRIPTPTHASAAPDQAPAEQAAGSSVSAEDIFAAADAQIGEMLAANAAADRGSLLGGDENDEALCSGGPVQWPAAARAEPPDEDDADADKEGLWVSAAIAEANSAADEAVAQFAMFPPELETAPGQSTPKAASAGGAYQKEEAGMSTPVRQPVSSDPAHRSTTRQPAQLPADFPGLAEQVLHILRGGADEPPPACIAPVPPVSTNDSALTAAEAAAAGSGAACTSGAAAPPTAAALESCSSGQQTAMGSARATKKRARWVEENDTAKAHAVASAKRPAAWAQDAPVNTKGARLHRVPDAYMDMEGVEMYGFPQNLDPRLRAHGPQPSPQMLCV